MKLNKAAMFGLDARIALAIFGALSVISGAALYSAIESAKVTSFITELNEVGKAWESYYVDTGTNLPRESSSGVESHVLRSIDLVSDNSVAGWSGPYLNYSPSTSGADPYLLHPDYLYIRFLMLTDEIGFGEAGSWASGGTQAYCNDSRNCFVWVSYIGIDSTDSIFERLDERIDGSDGHSAGNLRWDLATTLPWKSRLYYKYAAIANPN